MTMLVPSSLTVGFVSDAVPLSLMLPRSRHEEPFLIVRRDAVPVAVFLGGAHRFNAMDCPGNTSWTGMIVAGVEVEMDEESRFDAETEGVAGALVRRRESIFIGATADGRYTYGLGLLTVADGLPLCRERMSVGFRRWSVMLGTGLERRELLKVSSDGPS